MTPRFQPLPPTCSPSSGVEEEERPDWRMLITVVFLALAAISSGAVLGWILFTP